MSRQQLGTDSERVETAVVRATVWVVVGALVGAGGLVLPQPAGEGLLAGIIAHLAVLVAVGWAMTWDLQRIDRSAWFSMVEDPAWRWFAATAGVVAIVTGAVALITLASSAALRLDPSLQFLQLLSALDIAWVVSAISLGVQRLWGRTAAVVAGLMVAAACVWSIWWYLSVVGFTPTGGWLVDADALARHVLPFDVMAAVAAVGLVVAGARRHRREITGSG